MSFKDGLLAARGQIVFVLALTISTSFIIWLEALDTEERIQARVQAAVAERGSSAPSAPGPLIDRAHATLRTAEEEYARNPRAPETRAALLTALSAVVQLGARPASEAQPRVEDILGAIEAEGTPHAPALGAALAATAAAFPALRDRITRLPTS